MDLMIIYLDNKNFRPYIERDQSWFTGIINTYSSCMF